MNKDSRKQQKIIFNSRIVRRFKYIFKHLLNMMRKKSYHNFIMRPQSFAIGDLMLLSAY